jgi:sulfur carrier protein ThiS
MKIYYERDKKEEEIEIKKPKKIKQLLEERGISLESVILVKNDKIALEDEFVEDKDELKLLSVVSGG